MGKIGADLGWSRLSFLSSPLWRGYGAFRVKADTTCVEWQAPEVRHVSHTYAQNVIHVVFSTKDRRKSISPDFQPKVWRITLISSSNSHQSYLWPRQLPPPNRIPRGGRTKKGTSSLGSRGTRHLA